MEYLGLLAIHEVLQAVLLEVVLQQATWLHKQVVDLAAQRVEQILILRALA